jgi:DNA-binding transcriptional LysR family regulator
MSKAGMGRAMPPGGQKTPIVGNPNYDTIRYIREILSQKMEQLVNRLSAMQVFVAVVEAGGFTAASRHLGMPVPTVCRKIAELETHLGTQLLVRSTRKVATTDAGQRYYQDVRRILEEIEASERQASEEYQRPKGLLTITAPALFGHLHILPIIDDFMRRFSEVDVRLLFTNHMLDMPEEHIDLAVRIDAHSTSEPTMLPVGSLRQIVCASPAYLNANGRPVVPADLARHRCITFSRYSNRVPWVFRTPAGKVHDIAVRTKLMLNTAEAAADAAMRGCGLTQLYAYQGAHHIAEGKLEIILRAFEIEPLPVNVIIPHGQRVPQKVRAFIDFGVPALKARIATIAKQCDS